MYIKLPSSRSWLLHIAKLGGDLCITADIGGQGGETAATPVCTVLGMLCVVYSRAQVIHYGVILFRMLG